MKILNEALQFHLTMVSDNLRRAYSYYQLTSSFNFHNQNKSGAYPTQQEPNFRASLNGSNIPTSG